MRWFTQEQLSSTGLGRQREGGPVLVLLEYHVLDCIGRLPSDLTAKLNEAVPKVYDGGPDWRSVVRYNFLYFARLALTSNTTLQGKHKSLIMREGHSSGWRR